MCASDFLDWRAQRNASSFALVALFLLALLGFVALVFLPSILREMRLALPAPAGLGRWLSTGYRAIERLVRLWGLAVALGAASSRCCCSCRSSRAAACWPTRRSSRHT